MTQHERESEGHEYWWLRLKGLANRTNSLAASLAHAVANRAARDALPPEERRGTPTLHGMVLAIRLTMTELRLAALAIPAEDLRSAVLELATSEAIEQPDPPRTARSLKELAETLWVVLHRELPKRGMGLTPPLDETFRRPKRGSLTGRLLRELEVRRPQFVSETALAKIAKGSGFSVKSVRPTIAKLKQQGWPIESAPRGSSSSGWRLPPTDPADCD